ncbi:MAG TPA: hypothetical protein VGB50_09670 [Flavobacterium sp.]|jgi:hypothetical protein
MALFAASAGAQKLHLEAFGINAHEKKAIDSIGYNKVHTNAKSVVDEANLLFDNLKKSGYLETEILENTKSNDSTFRFVYSLGKRTKSIRIYIGRNPEVKSLAFPAEKRDTVVVALTETEAFMNHALNLLERKGYSLASLKLSNITPRDGILYAELESETGKQRQVNDIVISGYDKFPEGHKKQVKRLYRNKTFNQENLNKIYSDFGKFRFVTQTKYPEILFTEDTTKVYVYLEKAQANRFDGFIGFSNDEENGNSKLRLNGYVDLLLTNILNSGEELSIFWKSDGKEQKTFNAGITLPYIFKSPFGLKASLNIFRQDSTFQNTRTNIELGYFFNYNTRVYLGYQATESSDIQNSENASISDFKNSFLTSTLEFTDFKPDDFLFPEKTRLVVRGGMGSRESKTDKNPQFFGELNLMHNIYLNDKNSVSLRSQDFYLSSDTYIISELYRFGGINSIRGFNENSLQASMLTSLMTEYRYAFAPGLYIHSIIDYGYYRDESRANATGARGDLLGLGFGFGLLTKTGLFNLVYANGTSNGQQIKLSNSIVHISFRANF